MRPQTPLSLAQLAGAGTSMIGAIVMGMLLGYALARYAHWSWALPAGVLLGFVAGFVSLYRRISSMF